MGFHISNFMPGVAKSHIGNIEKTPKLTHGPLSSDEITFSCSTCDKKFSELSSLNEHEKIHSDETPFSCSPCDKKFAELSSLKEHEKIHSDETPFSCSVCDKKFSEITSLEIHEKTHSDNRLVPSDIEKVDMTLLRQFKKQKNYCNNLIKRDIRKALGRNIKSTSSVTEIWKAIVDS